MRESGMTNLTLVVPFFNESHRWQDVYWSELLELDWVRWIFVDDGSTDQTYEKLLKLPELAKYEIVRLSTNQGKGEAVRAGILHFFESQDSDTAIVRQTYTEFRDLVGFIDADGSITKSDISRIFEIAKTKIGLKSEPGRNYLNPPVNAIWSSRVALNGRNIERKISRHYIGRIINTILSPNFHSIPYDPQCGFKIFEASEDLKNSIAAPFKTRWFFDLEIILKWQRENNSELIIWEEPLETWKEISGSHLSIINFFSILREVLNIIFESRENLKKSKRRGNGP